MQTSPNIAFAAGLLLSLAARAATAAYDERNGVPTSWYVANLEFEDNDEGFRITSFEESK